MLRNPSLITFLILFSLQVVVAQNIDSAGMNVLRVNPTSAVGGKISDVFDSIEFIPLETTSESLFGSINNLQIVDGHFVFLDYDTRAIFVFSSTGKFRTKIPLERLSGVGSNTGPAFLFTIAKAKFEGKERIAVESKGKSFVIDLDGKLLNSISEKNTAQQGVKRMYLPDSENLFVEVRSPFTIRPDSNKHQILLRDNAQRIIGQYFPLDENSGKDMFVGNGSGIFNSEIKNQLFIVRPHDYNVYTISPEKMFLTYKLVFPANLSLPTDFLSADKYKNKRIQFLKVNNKLIYGVGNVYRVANRLFFKTYTMESNSTAKNAFVYDLSNKNIISIADLEPDKGSQFLPVTDAGFGFDFESHGFLVFDKGYFYTSYSTAVLLKVKQESKAKNFQYDAKLSDFFKTGNSKSNPILIKMRPATN